MKKKIISLLLCVAVIITMPFLLSGCRQAERVSHNISKEADYFNVCRRLSVINMRSDEPIFELVAFMSISNNTHNELVVTCEVGKGVYKQHYIYLNEWTMYVVEDLSGANVSQYHYEINFLPEMILPFVITTND